ncbi:MAG: hypothetical protein M3Q22_15730, partial [Actinomycetota bacterium]|nr:hypothetical protein [Actinomycetota bacterium]
MPSSRTRHARLGRRATLTAALACALLVPAGAVSAVPAGRAADPAGSGTLPMRDLDLDAATIPELQERMDAGDLTAV